ncbi:hypothetical protein Fcan01_23250 [Folsomia candida]|uniref:Ionotropic glutamate receptor C-terminal domain-containing protein n=1 Tax=Folsomia candida TaxID=158441 RepID=A0A226DAD9_FOLCA|nr:hypothetical protein Fcan01_23250 [Folsomia candida]
MSQVYDPTINTCTSIKLGARRFPDYATCAQLTLGGKFNFTDLNLVSGTKASKEKYLRNADFYIMYNKIITKDVIDYYYLYPVSAYFSWVPYCGSRSPFKMATVSFKKSTLEGLKGLMIPLNQYTWVASGVSFTFIALFLTISGLKSGDTFGQISLYFVQAWQWILSSLSGQYHQTPSIFRHIPHFRVLGVTCVLFFYLLGTVFYQGSMYSALIAVSPPDIASTMETVVDSKIQIITTSRVILDNIAIKASSLLIYVMNSDITNTTVNSARLFRTFSDLKDMLNFIHTGSEFLAGLNISEGFEVQFGDYSFKRVMDTFAVINSGYDLDEVLAGLEVKRQPYIIRHTELPTLFQNVPLTITLGFMSSFLFQGFGQLAESRLYEFWMALRNLQHLLKNVREKSSKEVYQKVLVTNFFGARKEIVFDEEKQVSLSALEGVLVLCAGSLGVAVFLFINELVAYSRIKYVIGKCRKAVP